MSERVGVSTDELEAIADTMEFIKDRLDGIAMWVIEWMPKEDNEKHHNAVEHLQRIHQEAERTRRRVLVAAGWPPDRIPAHGRWAYLKDDPESLNASTPGGSP